MSSRTQIAVASRIGSGLQGTLIQTFVRTFIRTSVRTFIRTFIITPLARLPHLVLAILIAVTLPVSLCSAQKEPLPDVPGAIQAHANEQVVLRVRGSGSQVYHCQSDADGKFSWTLKAPDAELADSDGKIVGRHFAGPTWKLNDGSEVKGKASAHVDSPDPDSIPWLLVDVVSNSGKGQLANVTTIQRVHTHGGKPPATGCDATHLQSSDRDVEAKSSYTADYYFYAPVK